MNMVNPEKYYKATIGNKPSALIRKFFMSNYDKKIQGNSALDLGCGVGNDTKFLKYCKILNIGGHNEKDSNYIYKS